MITYIIGVVNFIDKEKIILENNGIGYMINCINKYKLNETIKLEYIKNESMINVYGSIDDQKVFAAELTYE